MKQKHFSCGPVYDRIPPLSEKYQWLLAQSPEDDEDGTRDQFFFNIQDPLSCYRCQIPELCKKRIRGSFHGWLILSNDSASMWSLWDPINSKIMHLPRLILKDGDSTSIKECCLSLPPDDPKSILLLTRRDKPTFVFCLLENIRRKRLKWTEISYLTQLRRISSDGYLVHSLSCCNGKVYAFSTDGTFFNVVIEIGIEVKDGEVVIMRLMLFAGCPLPLSVPFVYFLRGSNTELFCITIGFDFEVKTDTTISFVSLHKLDMTSINCGELEGLKKWNISGKNHGELDEEELNNMFNSSKIWEQMEDLKDGNFFVDLARNYSVAYNPAISSEFVGNIHIRSKMGKVIHSYNVNDNSIVISSMFPSPVLPPSHVSVWECRLAADYAKGKQEVEEKDREIVGRLVNDDDVELNESRLLNLPYGVLEMIMEFCIGLEYLNFGATCKCCHLAAPVLQWGSEVAIKRLQNYSLLSPWLMMADEKRGIVTFEDPLYGYKYFMKKVPAAILADNKIFYFGYGWLLYHSGCGSDFCKLEFYNPFTNKVHHLPEMNKDVYTLCFSAPPTSPDCMVVGFSKEGIYIHFVNGEQTWRLVCPDTDDDDDDYDYDDDVTIFYFPTFYGRDIYALCDKGKLHVFKKLGQEDYSWKINVVEAPRSCRYPLEYFLTICGPHVLLIFIDHFGESIEVFKLNHFTNEWVKAYSLGRHTIYISDRACLCTKAKTPEMEDKIFFARVYNKNGKVVFYSLETGMYHTFSNAKNIEESCEDFVGTKYLLDAHALIEPSWD